MSTTRDWFPANREAQPSMAKDWETVITDGAVSWGILPAVITELDALILTADTALATAKNETTRTPVATAQCRETFDALTAKMRDIKKRYFLTPPLTEADYIALGLKPHGKRNPHRAGNGRNLSGRPPRVRCKDDLRTGTAADPANKGFRIWYSVIAPGETPPTNPDDPRKFFFTKRKKDVIEFDFGDSSKTAYFAVQIENEGKKGSWGPLVSALIP